MKKILKNVGELIGKGAFSLCFQHKTRSKQVVLQSICPIKDGMSEDCISNHRLFPKIRKIDWIWNSEYQCNMGVYEMPKYNKPKSLKNSLTPRQWRLYKALRAIDSLWGNDLHNFIRRLNNPALFPSEFANEKDAIIQAAENAKCVSSNIMFEISPRNVAVKSGKLILLDVFFCGTTLRMVRELNR